MAKRDEYLNNIRKQLGIFAVEVRLHNKVNRQGLNISAEDILGGLLNLIHDWQLCNANEGTQNFPAIDLADWDEGVVVQVSSDTTGTKIRDTLEKLKDPSFKGKLISKLVMMFLEPKRRYTTEFAHQGFELEIWDLDDLSAAVEHKSVSKLKEISDYLDEELGRLSTAAQKPVHLLPGIPCPSASFVEGSRDDVLAELEKALAGDQPIFLWGLGGIGKTEVAIQLAKRFAPPKGAYFLHYYNQPDVEEGMRETILQAIFSSYRSSTTSRQEEYRERMDILRTEYTGAMLIIDGFDCPGKTLADLRSEWAYQELTQMDLRLVFTTRNQVVPGGFEIKAMDENALLYLMRQSCPMESITDEALLTLIREVNGHTLMVDLMAKTLRESLGAVTPESMLEVFRQNDLKREDLPNIDNDQQGKNIQGRIDHHLQTLFDMSAMKQTEKAVLRYATFLPENGMEALLFKDSLRKKPRGIWGRILYRLLPLKHNLVLTEQQALERLIKTGWLTVSEKNLITIHPVIREVCRQELRPTDGNCYGYLKRLWIRFDNRKHFDADQFSQIAISLAIASDKLKDRSGLYAHQAGQFFNRLGKAETALFYNLRMVDQCENSLLPDTRKLSTAYSDVGHSYEVLGKYIQALDYQKKALEVCEKILSPDYAQLARIFGNLGNIYNKLGNYDQALEYGMKALDIQEKILLPGHLELAHSYSIVGYTYGALGDYAKALSYDLKALEIRERVLSRDHPDLALSYNSMGKTHNALGEYHTALRYYEKAAMIFEKLFLLDHPTLAASYNSIGITYTNLENHPLALEYLEKALAIREKVLPADHPDIMSTKERIKEICSEMQ